MNNNRRQEKGRRAPARLKLPSRWGEGERKWDYRATSRRGLYRAGQGIGLSIALRPFGKGDNVWSRLVQNSVNYRPRGWAQKGRSIDQATSIGGSREPGS